MHTWTTKVDGVDYPLAEHINSLQSKKLDVFAVEAYASLAEAVDQIGATECDLYVQTEIAITGNLTIPSTMRLVITRGGQIAVPTGVTLTINGTLWAGLYRAFSCTGTGAVVFGSGSVKEIHPEWWYSGSGVWDTALTAAITAAVTNCTPVILPSSCTIEGTIQLPPFTILRGIGGGGQTTSGYGSVVWHTPTAPGSAVFETVFTYPSYINSVEVSNVFIVGALDTNYSSIGISFGGVIGGKIHNVSFAAPFTTAAITFDWCIDCDVRNINIGNSSTTQATAAGFSFINHLTTTVKIENAYVHGVVGANGGITDAIYFEYYSGVGITLDKVIFESLSRHCVYSLSNNVIWINNCYSENVPNQDVAVSLFKFGDAPGILTGVDRIYINNGIFMGSVLPGTHANPILIESDHAYMIVLRNVESTSIGSFFSTTTNTLIVSISGCFLKAKTSFGTVAYTKGLVYHPDNWLLADIGTNLAPTVHRGAGPSASVPVTLQFIGQMYWDTDAGQAYWWDGANWVTW